MTNPTQVPIVQCTYQLAVETQHLVSHFPKAKRYDIGGRLTTKTLDLFESVTHANFIRDHRERGTKLNTLQPDLFTLKMLFRLAKDLKCISPGQHANVNLRLKDIQKQLTGWTKWTNSQVANTGQTGHKGP